MVLLLRPVLVIFALALLESGPDGWLWVVSEERFQLAIKMCKNIADETQALHREVSPRLLDEQSHLEPLELITLDEQPFQRFVVVTRLCSSREPGGSSSIASGSRAIRTGGSGVWTRYPMAGFG